MSNSRHAHFGRDEDVESEDENDSAKMSHAQSLKRGTQASAEPLRERSRHRR